MTRWELRNGRAVVNSFPRRKLAYKSVMDARDAFDEYLKLLYDFSP